MDQHGKEVQVERASSALADVDTSGWAQRFDLLSDPHRLEILLGLHRAPGICVSDLATALGRSENAVSQALRILRQLRDVLPDSPSVRELTGLAEYDIGNYRAAAKELEVFVELTEITFGIV